MGFQSGFRPGGRRARSLTDAGLSRFAVNRDTVARPHVASGGGRHQRTPYGPDLPARPRRSTRQSNRARRLERFRYTRKAGRVITPLDSSTLRPVPQLGRVALSLLLAVLFSSALLAQAGSQAGKRVRIVMKDGRTIENALVLEEKPDRIYVKRRFGQFWLKREDIADIETLRSPRELYDEKAAECGDDPDAWVELAEWCRRGDINLLGERQECLARAIELDPEHVEARRLRGDVKVKGKWYPEEEGNKLLGRIKVKGRWVDKEEYEREQERKRLERNPVVGEYIRKQQEYQGRPWATVAPIRTTNFFVKCNSTEDVAQYYSQLMEDLFDAFETMFPETEYPRYRTGRGHVYIFRNHDEFMDFTFNDLNIGGFYDPYDKAVRAYHGSFGLVGTTEEVLAHEATHEFQGRIIKNMMSAPRWLMEGMAVYYGDGTQFGSFGIQPHGIPRDRLHSLKQKIRTNRYVPLERFLLANPMTIGFFYDQSWGVIYWLLRGDEIEKPVHKGEGQLVWDQYLKHICEELPPVFQAPPDHLKREAELFKSLLLKHTGYKDVASWEADYKDFVMNRLQLEPLGSWDRSKVTWDGRKKLWVQLDFPREGKQGLEIVDDLDLRMEVNEVAAKHSTKEGARIWLSVYPNWNEKTDQDDALGVSRVFISSNFTKIIWEEEPEVQAFNGVEQIPLVTASFRGQLIRFKEVSVGLGLGGKQGEGGEPEGPGVDAAPEQPAPELEYDKTYRVRMGCIVTKEKIYMLWLAGESAPFARLERDFEKMVESVVLQSE